MRPSGERIRNICDSHGCNGHARSAGEVYLCEVVSWVHSDALPTTFFSRPSVAQYPGYRACSNAEFWAKTSRRPALYLARTPCPTMLLGDKSLAHNELSNAQKT